MTTAVASQTDHWDIDGTPLHSFGWNVATIGGGRYTVPPLRGEDTQFAYVEGRDFRPKLPDTRTLTLAMWLTGADPATGGPTGDARLQWNDSWAFLRGLLWQPGRQFVLTRRWLLSSPVAATKARVEFTPAAVGGADVWDYTTPQVWTINDGTGATTVTLTGDLVNVAGVVAAVDAALGAGYVVSAAAAKVRVDAATAGLKTFVIAGTDAAAITGSAGYTNTAGAAATTVAELQVASAKGQLAGELEPRMTGRTRSEFTVDIRLADPFFYGAETEATIDVAETATVTNPGDYIAARTYLYVDLVGPLVNPRLTNATPDPDVWVQYTGTIADGATVVLDVGEFAATSDADNVIAAVTHSGARRWMGLARGDNAVTLTADSGAGYAALRFRPPYV